MDRMMRAGLLAVIILVGCKKTAPTVPDSPAPIAPPGPKITPKPTSSDPPGRGESASGGHGVPAGNSSEVSLGGSVAAAQGVRRAVRRTQSLSELQNLGLIIEGERDPATGRMPTREHILRVLKQSDPTLSKAIDDGSFILTGTMDGGGLWAYEVDADKQAGVALIGGRATRTAPEEIQRYLNRP